MLGRQSSSSSLVVKTSFPNDLPLLGLQEHQMAVTSPLAGAHFVVVVGHIYIDK
jgi:hypothetical protein